VSDYDESKDRVQNTPVVSLSKKPLLFDKVRKSLPPIARIVSEKRLRPSRKIKRQVSAGRIKRSADNGTKSVTPVKKRGEPIIGFKSDLSFRAKSSKRKVIRK
jgi:hypothetical protein